MTARQVLQAARDAGGTVSTDGRRLRVRWWRGVPPGDVSANLKRHWREIVGILLSEVRA